tara:strand:+ start:130 stop:600 length:471 start_codon:yes stop_codon:yes gene_type:complete
MLKIKTRELPAVDFRRDLPDYLADGDPCYIKISARAGGAINVKYVTAMEALAKQAAILNRKSRKIEDEEDAVNADVGNAKKIAEKRLTALYDACVIDWESNILDGDTVIEATRDNFIELTNIKGVPELADALIEFEQECLKAGDVAKADHEGDVKN